MKLKIILIAIASGLLVTTGCEPQTTDTSVPVESSTNGAVLTPQTNAPATP